MAVAAGNEHSLFVTSDGTLWAMGLNGNGQLGTNPTNDTTIPMPWEAMWSRWRRGLTTHYSLKQTGPYGPWDWNADGELGNGATNDTAIPVSVASNVVSVAAGATIHCL